MTPHIVVPLLYFYGIFLVACGIVSVSLIGLKAKTALASGGISGSLSILIAYLVSNGTAGAGMWGVVLAGVLFTIFSWRSAKTLFKIFELIPSAHEELKGKGVAFLIISLMAAVSMVVMLLQIVSYA